jgi:aryl-alcohol dehydrogenase-like predicted oxidoreductase
MVEFHPESHFCMSPEFLRHQLTATHARLGTKPDVILLHNPEFYFADALNRGVDQKNEAECYLR